VCVCVCVCVCARARACERMLHWMRQACVSLSFRSPELLGLGLLLAQSTLVQESRRVARPLGGWAGRQL